MKTVVEYRYSYFTIFRMWGHAGSVWLWAMDQDELADATFYKGSMRTTHAYDKRIEGMVFQGFHDWRGASSHLSQYLQYQRCVNDVDTEWFCLHGYKCMLETSFIQLVGELSLPEGVSCLLLEGSAQVDSDGIQYKLTSMNHFMPRDWPCKIHGIGKAFLIKKAGDKPPVSAPPGVNSVHDAMMALNEFLV